MNMAKKWNILTIGFALLLSACAGTTQQLQQGKDSFERKDYSEAFKELKPAAERGNKDAQYAIGYMYFYGRGVTKNKVAAKKWIGKAAAQGQTQAIKAQARLTKKPTVKTAPLPDEAPIKPDGSND
jgi:TPR repeat protein